MIIEALFGKVEESESDTIVISLFEGEKLFNRSAEQLNTMLGGAILKSIEIGDFRCKPGELRTFYLNNKKSYPQRIFVAGLGNADEFDAEHARIVAASIIRESAKYPVENISSVIRTSNNLALSKATQAFVEGSLLALSSYHNSRKINSNEPKTIKIFDESISNVEEIKQGIRMGKIISDAVNLTRNLVNLPPNIATPTYLSHIAEELARDYGLRGIIGDVKWARERKMEAYLAVAKGAGEPPKFIVLENYPSSDNCDTIVIVGKGITFDTGGISIKPHDNMGAMKSDMAGAGVVLGVMKAVGELNLPVRVIGIAPCTENMPDANAYRPSDIYIASNGTAIEIINTDAEGRMALADALVFAQKYDPSVVIDLATLTGACVVALGEGIAAGVFSNDDLIFNQLDESSKNTNEKIWRLPLWDVYRESIKSEIADIKNSGGKNSGVGSSAIFLSNFVDYPWAHIDIAGMVLNKKEKSYYPVGATGFGVRLLIDFILNWNS